MHFRHTHLHSLQHITTDTHINTMGGGVGSVLGVHSIVPGLAETGGRGMTWGSLTVPWREGVGVFGYLPWWVVVCVGAHVTSPSGGPRLVALGSQRCVGLVKGHGGCSGLWWCPSL
ncbi:hypothetical protein AMECASPLE_015339 [Ameca splendens]|uniref:Uncharacterized protein n=1 Tax=Ameca splendens TaxID=208324 RepID=A0ABV1A926_9TELE